MTINKYSEENSTEANDRLSRSYLMQPMLNDRLNPDREAERKYMRIRTYCLCLFGELLLLTAAFVLGAACAISFNLT